MYVYSIHVIFAPAIQNNTKSDTFLKKKGGVEIQNYSSIHTFKHSNTQDCILAFPTELNSYFATLLNDHLTLKKKARVVFFSGKYFCRQLLYIYMY